MKILIVQLARFGDIYQTWPAIKAYSKLHPHVEIHYLARESFKDALVGLNEIEKIYVLPTSHILEPVVIRENLSETIQRNENFLNELIKENYDEVYNLTYSASSASLCATLEASCSSKVYGYSRESDGFLKINDDISEYFYAQVGIGKNNRIHVTDLFAWQLSVNLEEDDFNFKDRNIINETVNLPPNTLAIQVGSSQKFKSLKSEHWIELIRQLSFKGYSSFCLLGAASELEFAKNITQSFPTGIVKNLVGQFKIYEHFDILKKCQCLIAADSSMIHMASLVNTACVNISIGAVNFWETGPRAKNSLIAKFHHQEDIKIQEILPLIDSIFMNTEMINSIRTIEGCPSYYTQSTSKIEEFAWSFVRALYMDSGYPIVDDLHSLKSFHSFYELNKMIINEIEHFELSSGDRQQTHLDLMNSMENTLDLLSQKSRATMPLWNWIVGQRVRISHSTGQKYVDQLKSIHQIAESILKLYVIDEIAEERIG